MKKYQMKQELSKVSISKFDDDYIISVIIDKIYIFDDEGNFKNRTDFFTTEEDLYFTLAIHKIDNIYYHYYLVGYIYDSKLNLYYYNYDSSNNENNLNNSLQNYKHIYYNSYYDIQNKGITCQFIIINSTDIISCYYYVYLESHHKITITNFYINETLINYKNNIHYDVTESIGCFKSSVNPEHTKFITYLYYSSSGNIQCYIYDIINDPISFNYNSACLKKYYGLKVYYFPEKEKFCFSCFNEGGGIKIGFYNKELDTPENEINKFSYCEYIYGHSIIYSISKKDYILVSDIECDTLNYPFSSLSIIKEEVEEEEENKEEENEEAQNKEVENEKEENKEEENKEVENEKKVNEKDEINRNEQKKEIDNCNLIDFFDNKCELNIQNSTLEDNLIKDIEINIRNGKLISNKSKIIKNNNNLYQIVPLNSQNNNDYNISTIDIGECEDKLRTFYSISEDQQLLLFKIDIYKEGYKMPIVEYAIFKFSTGEKLELDVCKNIKINLSLPVSINEDTLHLHDPKSDFYNDICYTYTSESGIDISLEDRKKEYVDNNMTLCEEDYEFNGYNPKTKKAICKWIIKIN